MDFDLIFIMKAAGSRLTGACRHILFRKPDVCGERQFAAIDRLRLSSDNGEIDRICILTLRGKKRIAFSLAAYWTEYLPWNPYRKGYLMNCGHGEPMAPPYSQRKAGRGVFPGKNRPAAGRAGHTPPAAAIGWRVGLAQSVSTFA